MAPPTDTTPKWARIEHGLRVVRLSAPVVAVIPALGISAVSKSTRGLSLYPGRLGIGIGALVVAASIMMGVLLYPSVGLIGPVLAFWLLGTSGVAIVMSGVMPIAFVKTICTRCRLLPIVREHEAIHLSGVSSESEVWRSMRSRYTVEGLHLSGDPAICSFCPIPKRLAEAD